MMMTFLVMLLIHKRKESSSTKKQECLKSAIGKGKAHLLGYKWTQEKRDKASNKIINKTCAAYKQHELNEKSEKTGKALGKHAINLYSTGISRMAKIRDVKKLQQHIENDPIIKHQMARLDCLLVCIFSCACFSGCTYGEQVRPWR